MKIKIARLIALLMILCAFSIQAQGPLIVSTYTNDAATGTIRAGLVSVSSTDRVIATPPGSTDGVVGICHATCGIDGPVQIVVSGIEPLNIDNATTAGDWIQIGSSGWQGHDTGSKNRPTSGQIIGVAVSTHAGPGTYHVQLQLSGSATSGLAIGGAVTVSGFATTLRDFVSVKDYGAKGDTQEVKDAVLSNGASTVTSASARFASTDCNSGLGCTGAVDKACVIASFIGQVLSWQGDCTITGFTNSSTITVSITGSANYAAAIFRWGTSDNSVINTACSALAAGGTLFFPPGIYMTDSASISSCKSGTTLRGFNRYASVITGNHANWMIQLGATTPVIGLDVEDLGFDGVFAAYGILLNDSQVGSPAVVNNCRFYRMGIGISSSSNRVTITNNLFEDPGTFYQNAITVSNAGKGTRLSGNSCRFVNTCMGIGTPTAALISSDLEVSGNRFDGGWFLGTTAYSGSGGAVTYTSSTLTDSGASFPTLLNNTVIRVLSVRATGTASSLGTSSMLLVDAGASFVTAGVQRGDLIYSGTAVAMVEAIQDATHLTLDEWLDSATRLPVNPAAGAYTIYRFAFGKYTSSGSSATVLATQQGWLDFFGNAVTPSAGTLYEASLRVGNYPLQMDYSVVHSRVVNNIFKRGMSDQLSIYGNDMTVVGNDIYDGQDMGITANGLHHTITGNHIVHQGSGGIFADCMYCTISANNISYTSWTNIVNTVGLGDIMVAPSAAGTALKMVIQGNILDGGSNAAPWSTTIHRYGVAVVSTSGFPISDVTIAGNQITNHTVGDIRLTVQSGAAVAALVYGNGAATVSTSGGATFSGIPVQAAQSAGAAPTVGGDLQYDTTQQSVVVGDNGLTGKVPVLVYAVTPPGDAICSWGGDTTIAGVTCINAAGTDAVTNLLPWNTNWTIPAGFLNIPGKRLIVRVQFQIWSSATAPSINAIIWQLHGTSVLSLNNGSLAQASSMTHLVFGHEIEITGVTATTANFVPNYLNIPGLTTTNMVNTAGLQPENLSQSLALANVLQPSMRYSLAGVSNATGTYTYSSGLSACTNGTQVATATNGGGTGATGNITISGGVPTGVISPITNTGKGYTSQPTTWTVATCTGTGTFTTTGTLGGVQGNAIQPVGFEIWTVN